MADILGLYTNLQLCLGDLLSQPDYRPILLHVKMHCLWSVSGADFDFDDENN